MLAPRTSSAFVCLRCQFRLARLTLSPFFLAPSKARFSACALRRNASSDAAQEHPPEHPPEQPATQIHPHISPRPLGKIRKRRGKKIRTTTAALGPGIQTLGDESEIIVLREEGDDLSEEVPRPEEPSTHLNKGEASDQDKDAILAAMQQSTSAVTQDEINQQLDSFRPNPNATHDDPHYVSQAEFIKLRKRVTDGFNLRQLSNYFSASMGVAKRKVSEEVIEGIRTKRGTKGKGVISQTEWQPATTPLSRRLPGTSHVLQTLKMGVTKPALVDQILRKAWNLVLLEEIEAPGEIEISLKRWQLVLLSARESPTPLDKIGASRRAKMEIFWPHATLRITADKSSAEYAAQDVQAALHDTQTQTFEITPWSAFLDPPRPAKDIRIEHVYHPKDLALVEKLSGGTVQQFSNTALQIRGLNKTQAFDAQRYLIALLPLKRPSSSALMNLDATRESSSIYPVPSTNALEYRLRDLRLGRWSHPVSKASSPSDLTSPEPRPAVFDAIAPNEDVSSLDAALTTKALEEQVISAVQDRSWEMRPRHGASKESTLRTATHSAAWYEMAVTKIEADFGHALFPIEDSQSQALQRSDSMSFSGATPGVHRLLADLKDVRDDGQILKYRFIPSPYAKGEHELDKDGKIYPELSIVVLLKPNREITLRGVSLMISEQSHDVLLPTHATDIRFKRTQKVWLVNPFLNLAVKDVFDSIVANVESGERLTAPRAFDMRIPNWTIKGMPYESANTTTRPVQYLFTGIEHVQSVGSTYESHRISYSSVNAGKLGGQKTKLKLIGSMKGILSQKSAVRQFVKAAFGVAKQLTEGATSTKELKRPRMVDAKRRLRRAGMQQGDDAVAEGQMEEEGTLAIDAPDATEATEAEERTVSEDDIPFMDPGILNLLGVDESAPASNLENKTEAVSILAVEHEVDSLLQSAQRTEEEMAEVLQSIKSNAE